MTLVAPRCVLIARGDARAVAGARRRRRRRRRRGGGRRTRRSEASSSAVTSSDDFRALTTARPFIPSLRRASMSSRAVGPSHESAETHSARVFVLARSADGRLAHSTKTSAWASRSRSSCFAPARENVATHTMRSTITRVVLLAIARQHFSNAATPKAARASATRSRRGASAASMYPLADTFRDDPSLASSSSSPSVSYACKCVEPA